MRRIVLGSPPRSPSRTRAGRRKSCVDTLPAELQTFARANLETGEPGVLSAEMARAMFGNDLDDAQFATLSKNPCLTTASPE